MNEVAAAISISEGQVLVTRRAADQKLAGYWEFPGGKLEPGETAQECIVRELNEELGVHAVAGEVIATSDYSYPGGAIRLIAVSVTLQTKDLSLTVHDKHAWVAPEELLKLKLAPADIPIAEELRDAQIKDLS